MKELDARSLEILDAVVRLNIETGAPVSSGLVERSLDRPLSSATIRAVMKTLEVRGFLTQPHASAGRLPTDAGFRVFVERLRSGWRLQPWEPAGELRSVVRRDVELSADNPEGPVILARLLSRLTRSISIILGPSLDAVKARRVELYQRPGRRVLMVLLLDNGRVRTGLLRLNADYAASIFEQAAQVISERIDGLTVGDIRAGVLDRPHLMPSPVTRCADEVVSEGRHLFAEPREHDVQLDGVTHVLGEPEFRDPEPLQNLLRFMASPGTMRDTLGRLDSQSGGDLGVWIGQENPVDELRPFAVITGRYQGRHGSGLMAVLGPRRMYYGRALQSLELMRQTLQGI